MKYFKGYYFKCSDKDKTVAFIPALHKHKGKKRASIQIITNENVYVVPYSKIKFGNKKIKIGSNYFSDQGIYLDIDSKDCCIHGKLKFGIFQKLAYSIMGPFQYIPNMQCKHRTVSMRHSVTGRIMINDRVYTFKNGVGYIEGDSGCSFPKEYIWTQCHFAGGSLMLAIAEIPLLGFRFKGIIGVVMIQGIEYRIATYLGAKIILMNDNTVVIKQGKYTFSAMLIETNHQKLHAPVKGEMKRVIHESISCKARYQFAYNSGVLLDITSKNASFEYEMSNKK